MHARHWLVALAGGGMAALTVKAVAQPTGPATPPPPTLHADVRSPRITGPRRGAPVKPPAASSSSVIGEEPAPGRNPTAIGTGEKILPEPRSETEPDVPEEPVLGRGGFAADRRTQAPPDKDTRGDGTLRYVEAFNPSVVPFKRMSALSAVRDDWTLTVGEAATTELPVGGRPTPGHDRFWGSVLVELRPGEEVPLPSVAPEMRILSYEASPRATLTFSKDGDDNYWVRGDEAGVSGVHRLVFLVEADPAYFAPRVPDDLRLSDIPAHRVRPLPPGVQNRALDAHHLIGVRRTMSLKGALDRLVDYFREFQPKEIDGSYGLAYWDLVKSQAGVCRHRSYAFMITANALGIPTRFVSNEAHAWVESWIPRVGWVRIDLGGAALRLEVKNGDGKSMYRPRGEDPFPKPEAYSENYTRLEGDVTGLSGEQIAEAQNPRPGSSEGDGSGEDQGDNGDGSGESGEGDGGSGDGSTQTDGRPGLSPDRGMPAIPPSALRGKKPTSIIVTGATATGFRGEGIRVQGAVADASARGLAGELVQIYLAPAGHGGEGARLVGHAVTAADGTFATNVVVPFDLDLIDHEVYASTPGDDHQQPAQSK